MPLLLDLRDQTFADQHRILSRHELPALGCTRRLDEAETASLWTPLCLPTKKSASTRSATSAPQGCGSIRTEFSVGTRSDEHPRAAMWPELILGDRNSQG